MTYMNRFCADAGTVNCPCPLAETRDCLVCSRLSGKECCDCRWTGVCVYNEYVQNDQMVRTKRENIKVPVIKKICYDNDVVVMTLGVPKGFALEAALPGSFVFVNVQGGTAFSNVPVSVMMSDSEKNTIYIALKIISSKTKAVASAEDFLFVRGVYRNGLLGKGLTGMYEDVKRCAANSRKLLKGSGEDTAAPHWLVVTKGIGFAPAVNLLKWAGGRVKIHMAVDTEKINKEIISDCMIEAADIKNSNTEIEYVSLTALKEEALNSERSLKDPEESNNAADFERVIIFTSDFYIKKIMDYIEVSDDKVVFSNNFRMCCGEGICGACGHIDSSGMFSKMCKCRELDIDKLL